MKTTVLHKRFLPLCVLVLALGGSFPAFAQYTGTSGEQEPFDNRKPVLTLSFLICTNATFPNRGPGLGNVKLTQALLGQIIILPYNKVAPSGFAFCEGQTLSIASDAPLFAMLGPTFGGNGTTTFGLPDLRGIMPMGTGTSTGLGTIALGEQVGDSSTSWSIENLPPHVHSTPSGNTSSVGDGAPFSTMAPALGLGIDICTNGQLMIFAGNFIPAGWVACDGSVLNVADQPVLFSVIGTTYGGNGTTTFTLPDFQGRIPVCAGAGPDLTYYYLGESFGASTNTLSLDQMATHDHSIGTAFTGSAGDSLPIDITQPALAVNWFITPFTGTIPSASGSPPTLPLLGELRLGAGSASTWGDNWIQPDGQAVEIVDNEALYAFMGGTYGTNNNGDLFLPNVSSRSAVGFGQNLQSGITYSLGETAGSESVTMSYLTLPEHEHLLPGEINVLGPGGTVLNSGTVTNNFGSAAFGAPVSDTFTVANIGGLNLAVSNLVVGGANPGDFSVSPLSTTNIGLYAGATFAATFSPLSTGTRTATISITNSDAAADPVVIPLLGTGAVGPSILSGTPEISGGKFQFSFMNFSNTSLSVFSATNLSPSNTNWTFIGSPTNTGGNQFQFAFPMTNGEPERFFRVRSP